MISYFNCGTVETLPIAIYSMTRRKVSPEIYALSTIMFAAILAVILLSNAAEGRRYKRDQAAQQMPGIKGGKAMKRILTFLSALVLAGACAVSAAAAEPIRVTEEISVSGGL